MKNFKKNLIGLAYIGSIVVAPMGLGAVASAQEVPLDRPIQLDTIHVSCTGINGEFPFSTSEGCDLSVDKLVSVNGGAFEEADTSADAAMANVGDTITWKIIVTNNSDEGLTPSGAVYVHDVLPGDGVDYVSSSATAGNYITSGLFENYWYLPLKVADGDSFVTSLPATLTIESTSTSTGLFQNTATLAKYDPGSCDGGCVYSDSDPSNDSNDAWIDPIDQGQVLAASTGELTDTGSGVGESLVAGSLIAATLAVSFLGRSRSKTSR